MPTLGDWTTNTIMLWAGSKITDHGRSPLTESYNRIGVDKRMANGTLRRMFINSKRTWSCSWDNLPGSNNTPVGFTTMKTADGGLSGEQMEAFYLANPGKFRMVLKRGTAVGKATPNPAETALPYVDANFYITNVMITEFSKEIRKRGATDLWSMNVTLEEV